MTIEGGLHRGRIVCEQRRCQGNRQKKGKRNEKPPGPPPPGAHFSRQDLIRHEGHEEDERSPYRQVRQQSKVHLFSLKMRSSSSSSFLPSRRERTKWASIGESAPSKTRSRNDSAS